jgi:hypothetical protein
MKQKGDGDHRDLRIQIRELQWAHRRSSGPQVFTCFQDAKKERAV